MTQLKTKAHGPGFPSIRILLLILHVGLLIGVTGTGDLGQEVAQKPAQNWISSKVLNPFIDTCNLLAEKYKRACNEIIQSRPVVAIRSLVGDPEGYLESFWENFEENTKPYLPKDNYIRNINALNRENPSHQTIALLLPFIVATYSQEEGGRYTVEPLLHMYGFQLDQSNSDEQMFIYSRDTPNESDQIERHLIIGFRGTVTSPKHVGYFSVVKDVVTDLFIWLADMETRSKEKYEKIQKMITEMREEEGIQVTKVDFCGHSLGGRIACKVLEMKDKNDQLRNIESRCLVFNPAICHYDIEVPDDHTFRTQAEEGKTVFLVTEGDIVAQGAQDFVFTGEEKQVRPNVIFLQREVGSTVANCHNVHGPYQDGKKLSYMDTHTYIRMEDQLFCKSLRIKARDSDVYTSQKSYLEFLLDFVMKHPLERIKRIRDFVSKRPKYMRKKRKRLLERLNNELSFH